MKDSPISVFREVRQLQLGEPRRTARSALDWLVLALALLAIGGAAVLARYAPLERTYRNGHVYISWFSIMLVITPVLLFAAAVWFAYTRWRDRGTVPFAFPVTIQLPRWWVFRRDGNDALYLTDGAGLICLFRRPTPEPLAQVIDVVDPGKELETADPEGDALMFDVPDSPRAAGMVMHFPLTSGYAMVFVANETRIDDIAGVLRRSAHRDPERRPQKWRPLSGENVVRRPRAPQPPRS